MKRNLTFCSDAEDMYLESPSDENELRRLLKAANTMRQEMEAYNRTTKIIRELPKPVHSNNTKAAYRAAITHYRDVSQLFLPTTVSDLAWYLATQAATASPATLRLRVSALSAWHRKFEFEDPTKSLEIRTLIRNLELISDRHKKVTTPLKFENLQQIIDHLENKLNQLKKYPSRTQSQEGSLLRCYRDKALILFGFWRGFVNHQLSGLVVEQLEIIPNQGMTILAFDSYTQSLREFFTPFLKHYCPVKALEEWLTTAGIAHGPIFRSVNRWGEIDSASLHPKSLTPIFRGVIEEAGLDLDFTGHSLRRGFAAWAVEMGWDIKSILEYVGWANLNQHHGLLVKRTTHLQAFLMKDGDTSE